MRKLIAFLIRREACKMAARAIQNHHEQDSITPRLWSLTVFFESYMREGAEGTQNDFGPKPPVDLKEVA